MFSTSRTKVLIGICYVLVLMNNVNLAWSSILNISSDKNSVNLTKGPQSATIVDTSPQKAPSDLRLVYLNCSKPSHPFIKPIYSKHSKLKKCCPFGELLEESEGGSFRCAAGGDIDDFYVVFYGDSKCARENKETLQFSYVPNDSCFRNSLAFRHSKQLNNEFFATQNGSLLVKTGEKSSTVFDFYCVDVDSDGKLVAKVCDEVETVISKTTAVMIYVGLVVASIALVITCLAYAFVPKLNDFFGYLLVGHAGTFLVGMVLMTLKVCGDRCIDHGVEESVKIIAHIFLITSVFIFLIMNIHNYVYAICYNRNDLELNIQTEEKIQILLAISFTTTIILLCQPWRNTHMFHFILYIYYAVIAIVLVLSHSLLRKMVNSLQFIRFSVSRGLSKMVVNEQARIYGERLTLIKSLNRLCQVEAAFTLFCWLGFSSQQLHPNEQNDEIHRIAAAYSVIVQGILIGLIFLGRSSIRTTFRNFWIGTHLVELDENSELEKL